MASFNKVFLMGNLTRDPQLKYLPSQTPVVEFGIACNRKFRTQAGEDREEVTFVDCAAFGKTAEVINQYFQKGRPIFIEGRLKYDSWEDKQGGGKRSRLTVQIENFQFIGDRGQGGQGGGGGGQGGDYESSGGGDEPQPSRGGYQQRPPQQRRPAPQRPPAEAPFSEEQQFKDDDIPF
jgi:single-strand DNA-binding protein